MKKTVVAALLMSAITPAHAIFNGAEINSPEFVRVGGTCSGTVIAGKWVVTAAHCGDLTGQTVSNIDVSVANIKVLRGILGKWKLTDRVLVNWLSPNTPPPSPCCRRASY